VTAQLDDNPLGLLKSPLEHRPSWRALSVFRSRSPQVPLPGAARWERQFVRALFVLDVVLVTVSVSAGVIFHFDAARHLSVTGGIGFLLAPLWIVLLVAGRVYERDLVNLGPKQFKATFDAVVWMAALTAFLGYLTRTQIARGFFLIALPGGFFAMILGRFAARALLHRARRHGRCLHRVLAVGLPQDIEHLLKQLEGRDQHGLRVVAACCVGTAETVGSSAVPIVGLPSEARRAAGEVKADTVAVASTGVLGREGLRRLAWQLEGSETSLLVTPELTDVAGPRVSIRPVGALSLLQVSEPKFSGARRIMKGAFDRSLAAIALLAALPLLLVIAILIKLDSRGTVLFRQTRSGKGGKPFQLVKFRSMVPAAEDLLIDLTAADEGNGVLFKIRRDPRVTRVGRILRRVSLDELPQLWNILAGQMSLVGPRPPLVSEVEAYGDDVRRRLLVKPGLTGLWQVSGRSDLSWEESVRLDLYYVENWSLSLDLMILARTAGAVVAGRGAY
jgi:exopolysaccharide biosynthesis polyprenyl glycosylphosphotransferase